MSKGKIDIGSRIGINVLKDCYGRLSDHIISKGEENSSVS